MNITLNQQNEITNCIKSVFTSTTESSILRLVKHTINTLRAENFFSELPPFYENLSIETMEEILSWYQEMKEDDKNEEFEEGHLKELYGLFSAVNQRVQEL